MVTRKSDLIDATKRLMLRQGYAATTVDQICAEAKVTKGSFFHYFPNKEEICRTAMSAWSQDWHDLLSQAKLDEIEDPLDRLEALFKVMETAYMYPGQDPGCMVGTVAQETALPNDQMRQAVDEHLQRWQVATADILKDAKRTYPPKTDFDPDEVSWWLCTFVQGTMLMAKVRGRQIVPPNIRHCRAYVRGLFGPNESKK